jgi:malic enzyme
MISRGKSTVVIGLGARLMGSTGSVILGGFINAAKMASTASGRDARDHRVVFLGGGSAAVGYVHLQSQRVMS